MSARRLGVFGAVCWVALATSVARAQDTASSPSPDKATLEQEVRDLRAKVVELEASRDAAQAQIEQMRATLDSVQRRLGGATPAATPGGAGARTAAAPTPAPQPSASAPAGATTPTQPGAAGQPGTQVAQAEQPPTTVGEEKEEQRRFQAERAILERQGGVLVPAGQLVVEPSFQYAYDSARSLNLEGASFENVIFIGRFNVQRVTRDVFEPSLLMRYGLQRRVQLELTVPYLFRTDEFDNNIASTQQGVERTDSLHNNGFGDIQLGLFTQLLYQRSWWPDVVLNLQASFPTGDNPFELSANQVPLGSGTYGFSGGFSVVRTLDPVVLFGGIRYTYDLEHDFGSPFGKIQYGGNIEYNAGMALALNERLALTMTLQSNIQGKTRCDSSDPSLNGLCMGGKKLQGTNFNSAQVFLGGSYRVTRLTTVNAAVGIGLTDDSPDYTINFSVPIRFPETFWHL